MKKVFLSVFILIFYISTFLPYTISAEENGNADENVNLYKVTDEILINGSMLLKEGIFLYGKHELESDLLKIQFGNTEVEISKESVEKVEDLIDTPEFQDVADRLDTLKEFTTGDILYSKDGIKELVEFSSEVEYPVTSNNLFIIGNVILDYSIIQETSNLEPSESESASKQEDSSELKEEELQIPDYEESMSKISESEIAIEEKKSANDTELNELDSQAKEQYSLFSSTNQLDVENYGFKSSDKYFKVTKDTPVYDNSTGGLIIIGYLKKGEVYPRYESSPSWHLIQFGNGKYFVKKEGTEPVSGNSLKNINTKYKITSDTVTATKDMTVYDNTSGDLVPFGVVKAGQKYAISHDYGGAWIYIVFADRVGYIKSSELIRNYYPPFGDYFRVLEDNLPIYDNSSGELVEVGSLKKGQIYPRHESSKNWHLIQFGKKKFHVKKDGTEPASGDSLKNINTKYSIKNDTVTATKDMTVYDNTTGSLVPFGLIKKGQEYAISHDYGGEWIYIVLADRVGYIKSSELIRNYYPPFGDYFRVLEDSLPVYDNSSGKLVEIGSLKKNQEYPRFEGSPNWHQIQFGDIKAYVTKDGTEPSNGGTLTNENNNQYKNSTQKVVSKSDIIVYDNSSGKLVPFGTIKANYPYTIVRDYGGKWIYVLYAGRIGFVESSLVEKYGYTYTNYNITLNEALNMQMKVNPQTDKYRNSPAYISSQYVKLGKKGETTSSANVIIRTEPNTTAKQFKSVKPGTGLIILSTVKGESYNGSTSWYKVYYEGKENYIHASLANEKNIQMAIVTADSLNIRSDASASSHIYGSFIKGTEVEVIGQKGSWLQVPYNTWRNATSSDTLAYLDPTKNDMFQHLDLSSPVGATAAELNRYLKGKGILEGMGQAFVDAARKQSINELYLISHAVLETGNGTSNLAKGITVKGKKVYNMFGVNAFDNCPDTCGSQKAYDEGWDTPYKAIVGGAKFIGERYIHNEYKQNTLYKMRWNPQGLNQYGYATHQYATDIGWATKQLTNLKKLHEEFLDNPVLKFNIVKYKV